MTDALPGDDLQQVLLQRHQGDARVIDAELLLQETFHSDPREGCALLFRLYYAPLCSHAIRFVYSRQVAEDIVGDVFCRFWDERIFERIATSFRAYLFKSVRHRAYNYVKFELCRTSGAKFPADAGTANPCDLLQYDELYQMLDQTINGLPQQCKRVFLLSRMENKGYRDIARELNVSVKAIEAQISKALRILRERVSGY